MTQHLYKFLHEKEEVAKVEDDSESEPDEKENQESPEMKDGQKDLKVDTQQDANQPAEPSPNMSQQAKPISQPDDVDNENEEVDSVYSITVQIHKLDVLPHAHLEDEKPNMHISVEAIDADTSKNIYISKSSKPKMTGNDNVLYKFKKSEYFTVKTSKTMRRGSLKFPRLRTGS